MNQVIVGVFASYRDGHDALRALQDAGLNRDDAHLYRAGKGEIDFDAFPPPAHDEDDAEYVAHGEHQGVCSRNRFVPAEPVPRTCANADASRCRRRRARTHAARHPNDGRHQAERNQRSAARAWRDRGERCVGALVLFTVSKRGARLRFGV